MALLVLLCFAATFYAYFGYPAVLRLLTVLQHREVVRAGSTATGNESPEHSLSMSIIITARNEAKVIRQKLENTLELEFGNVPVGAALIQPEPSIEVIVASDASDDGTNEIVAEYASQGVKLVALSERAGKEFAQREAVQAARGEVVVFTDAKIELEPTALNRFRSYFSDSAVGAVSTTDRVVTGDGENSGEGFYVRYEMWLRSLESDFHSLVGLSGSCFAVRRELCADMPTDIPSDFALLIEAIRRGYRGVHGADIVASYRAVKTGSEEFHRKVRTVLRGITTLMARAEVMNPSRYGRFAWQVISHKLMRWLVPWFLLIALIGTLLLAFDSQLFRFLLMLELGFVLLATIGFFSEPCRTRTVFKVPLFFILVNSAISVAWLKFWSGRRTITWEPSAKGAS